MADLGLVVITFNQLAETLGSADREIRNMAAEMSAFSQVLGSVSKSFLGDAAASPL